MTSVHDKETGKEKAFRYIKDSVVARDLPPGDAVGARCLAKEITAAPGLVREAVDTLIQEDWTMRRPEGQMRVEPVLKQDLIEITQLRHALEPMIVESIMPRLSRKQFVYLDALLSQHERLLTFPNAAEEFQGLDRSFHLYLASLTENRRLISIMQAITDVHQRIGVNAMYTKTRCVPCLAEHAAIVESLRRADCAAAKEAVTSHIDRAYDALVFHLHEC